jgi:hypothetical protein
MRTSPLATACNVTPLKGLFQDIRYAIYIFTLQIENSKSATVTKAKQPMHASILGAKSMLHILRLFETRSLRRTTGHKERRKQKA